jgi:hypothetical protein
MRPDLDVRKLFPVPDTSASNDTIPVTARAPASSSRPSGVVPSVRWPEVPAAKERSLSELDSFLSARLLRFEVTAASYDDAALLVEARTLRSALRLAGVHAEPLPTNERSFESALADTLRGVYAWAFVELDGIFLHEAARPLPKRVANEIVDHAEVAAIRSNLDASLAPLESVLVELAAVCARLGRR